MKNKSFSLEALKGTIFLGSWTTFAQIISLINSFLVLYLLTVYEYGLYVLVFSIINMSEGALYESMDQLIITDILIEQRKGAAAKAKRIYQEYAFFKIVVSLLIFAFLFLGAEFIGAYFGYSSIGLFIKLGAFMVLFRGAFYFIHINLRINKKFNQMGSFTFIMEFLKMLFLLVMFFYLDPGIAKVIFISALANLCSFLILFYRNREDLKYWFADFKISFGRLELWKILRGHGKWNFASGLVAKFSKNVKPWLVKLFIGTEAVAIYNFGKNLFSHLDGLVPAKAVINQLLPDISGDREKMKQALIYGSKYISLLLIIICLFGAVVAPAFVWLLFPKYLWSIPIFYIFLIGEATFGGLGQVSNSLIFTLRQQKWLAYIPAVKVFSVLIFNSLLMPIFGIMGMAWEFVITGFIGSLLTYLVAIKKMNLPWQTFLKMLDYTEIDKKVLSNIFGHLKNKLKNII